jgi:hypothetical protein
VKDLNGDFFVLSAGSECLHDFRDNNSSKAFPMQFSHGLAAPSDEKRRFLGLNKGQQNTEEHKKAVKKVRC